MAKKGQSAARRKSNRRATSQPARPATTQPKPQPAVNASSQAPAGRLAPKRAVSAQTAEASQQYPYVLGDLKQLGITAAAMFVVLIALSLIIR